MQPTPTALLQHAQALEHNGAWDEAASVFRAAFRSATEHRDALSCTEALRGSARVHRLQGRYDIAEEVCDTSREIARRHGFKQAEARATNLLAVIRYHKADWASAHTLYGEAIDLARDLGDNDLIALACQNLGVVNQIQGDLHEAKLCYLEALAAAVREPNRALQVSAYNNIGLACLYLRGWLDADLYFARAIEVAEQIGNRPLLCRLLANRAEALFQMDDIAAAESSLNEADELAAAIGDAATPSITARRRSEIARSQGDLARALQQVHRALAASRIPELGLEHGEALREHALVLHALGEPHLPTLEEAIVRFRAQGAEHHLRETLQLLTQWGANLPSLHVADEAA